MQTGGLTISGFPRWRRLGVNRRMPGSSGGLRFLSLSLSLSSSALSPFRSRLRYGKDFARSSLAHKPPKSESAEPLARILILFGISLSLSSAFRRNSELIHRLRSFCALTRGKHRSIFIAHYRLKKDKTTFSARKRTKGTSFSVTRGSLFCC